MATPEHEVPSREEPYDVILEGTVGSKAYGLDHPGSDVDKLGVFIEPTRTFLGLSGLPVKKQSWKAPGEQDRTLHELAKYCSKVLAGNPTFTELLWLPDELYDVRTRVGRDLIGLRQDFLSATPVRKSYLGYAEGQFNDLKKNGRFSSDTQHRTAKHARHMARLMYQGLHAWKTGEIKVRLDNPQEVWEFGERVADGDLDLAFRLKAEIEEEFNDTVTVLPEEPNRRKVDRWLTQTRVWLLNR